MNNHNDNIIENIRLNKFIALHTGVSRRSADEIIREGRITLNGKNINQLATAVADKDIVLLDGKRIGATDKNFIYLMINKPKAFLTSRKSEKGFRTVMDLIDKPEIAKFVFPVGRLDFMSEGLLLMTNDGDFAYKVTHPKFNVIKSYVVEVKGEVTPEISGKIKKGVYLNDVGLLKPHNVKVIKKNFNKYILLIDLKNGKNREIRKILEFLNLEIILLRRIKIGGLPIGDLRSGEFKIIKKNIAELVFKKEIENDDKKQEKTGIATGTTGTGTGTGTGMKGKLYFKDFKNKNKDKNNRNNIFADRKKRTGLSLKNSLNTKDKDKSKDKSNSIKSDKSAHAKSTARRLYRGGGLKKPVNKGD
ncbi:MAG: pseudouridine synthase [bacterium]